MKINNECFKDDAAIEQMIEELGSINNNDENGMTPLCFAALNGIRSDIIVKLINKYSADPNKKCSADDTNPLQNAIMSGVVGSIYALIGTNVVMCDDAGNQVDDKSSPLPDEDQPKKDAAGNPLPERDEDDNIVYQYYKDILIPLDHGEPFVSNTYQQRCKINNELRWVPPANYELPEDVRFSNITYKFDKDGSHSQMRDTDGVPLKQYYQNSKEIHKLDDNGKPLKNNFEYVWDYEGLPKYQVAYNPIQTHASIIATIRPEDILIASKQSSADALGVILHKYCNCTSEIHHTRQLGTAQFLDENGNNPIYLAISAGCADSVGLLLLHDTNATSSVNHINDTGISSAMVAIQNGDDGILSLMRQYMKSINNSSTLEDILDIINDDDLIPEDARSDCIGVVLPFVANMEYGESVYPSANAKEFHGITLPGTNSAINYIELALKYLDSEEVSSLRNTILHNFITYADGTYTAKDITNEFPLVKKKCYTILNLLHNNSKFDLTVSGHTVINAQSNRDAINNAIAKKKLDTSQLSEWPWWDVPSDEVTLTFTNYSHSDVQVLLPEAISDVRGADIVLPSVIGEYTDSSNIRWVPMYWNIGGVVYEFGSIFLLSDNTSADIVCEKSRATLSFTNTYLDLHIEVPDDITAYNGDTVLLPSVSGTFTDVNNIIWQATKWDIGDFDSYFTLSSNTVANLVCSRKKVTVTFENTLYDTITIPLPLPITVDCGYFITLPSVSGEYTDGRINYTPKSWSVGSFNSQYAVFNDITVYIECTEAPVQAGIIFNDATESIQEGNSITRAFKLASKPLSDVVLSITSNLNSRLYIQQDTITFTQSDWYIDKSVTFTAIDNDDVDGDGSAIVSITASSSDSLYNGLAGTFNITIMDDDTANIGTLAFVSGAFPIDIVDNNDTIIGFTKNSTTRAYKFTEYRVKDTWDSVYEEGYTVTSVPKSPHYSDSDTSKHFKYDLLYQEGADS